jgi:hypothetical protein
MLSLGKRDIAAAPRLALFILMVESSDAAIQAATRTLLSMHIKDPENSDKYVAALDELRRAGE